MKNIFTALCILSSLSIFAQTTTPCFYGEGLSVPFWCGAMVSSQDYDGYSKQDITRNLSTLSHRDDISWAPVWYHIITRDDGTCGGPWKDIFDGHCELNKIFLAFNIGFYIQGIDTVPDTYLWNYEDPALGNTTYGIYNKPDVINVYINGNMPGLCGFATFPFTNPTGGGIFLHRNCIGADKTTYPHEMGHYLGLMHTFETTFGKEFVNGTNCSFTGDLYCDTPADFLDQRIPCPYTGNKTDPNGDLYRTVIDPSLYMSYFNDACQNRFSTMQKGQMTTILTGTRSYLLTNTPPDLSAPDTAVFINPVAGNTMVNSSHLTFKWHAVPGATYYRFAINSAVSRDVLVDTVVADTFVYVGNIHPNKKYKYYAKPVSFGNTCGNPASYRYIQTSSIKLDVKIIPPVCSDAPVDTVIITPISGEPPFAFQWAHGAEDSLLTNLSAGDYYVTVSDRLGNEVSELIQMIPPQTISIRIEASTNNLVAWPSGGTPPYSFSWSNGVKNQFNNYPEFGDYTVTVTDAKGCMKVEEFSYTSIGVQTETKVGLKIFPNPAARVQNMNIQVELNERTNGVVLVMNIHGELMQEFRREFNSGVTNLPINIQSLSSGLYFVRFSSSKTNKTEKFTLVQ
ncbi:MAG: T9SS type A sorting domain-containing protein [Bacteroidetes bacterium]|nr:T9SS type A sorting domain-containing protein [Bacteroidota bacterium]